MATWHMATYFYGQWDWPPGSVYPLSTQEHQGAWFTWLEMGGWGNLSTRSGNHMGRHCGAWPP